MSLSLSITVSGAVSLGSYEAGVLYEIVRAIGQHNLTATDPDAKIFIDVLTGASAGGMTAAILAQKLMFEAEALEGPYANALYQAWVVDVDIEELLTEHTGDSDSKSILSSGLVEQISRRYLTARYSSHADVPRVQHTAAADKIWLGFALSNLNGVDYGKNFVYTRFQDELTTCIENQPSDDSLDYWDPLRNAAVSCGAFPFAFRPIDVIRHPFEYEPDGLKSTISPNQSFCYTDGGVFQNQPLGMAKNLVDKIDPTHVKTDRRYYLFVSPEQKKSIASAKLNASNADFIPFTKQLVAAIFGQAGFQDWAMAEKVNEQVALLDARANELATLLSQATPQSTALASSLQATADRLLPMLLRNVQPKTPGNSPIDEARNRLKVQYREEYARLPPSTRNIWIDSILTLEAAASLGERDEMKIIDITAGAEELAGADLAGFCGFFDFKYRKHDYDVGRKKAQEFLGDPASPFGAVNFTPEPIDAIDARLSGLKLESMDEQVRTKIYTRFKSRILDVLDKGGANLIERTAAFDFVIAPRLKKLLKL